MFELSIAYWKHSQNMSVVLKNKNNILQENYTSIYIKTNMYNDI